MRRDPRQRNPLRNRLVIKRGYRWGRHINSRTRAVERAQHRGVTVRGKSKNPLAITARKMMARSSLVSFVGIGAAIPFTWYVPLNASMISKPYHFDS